MENTEIELHLGNQPQGEPITEARIRKSFKHTKFHLLLAFMSLPQGPHHDDRVFYFHWLHEEKKVNKIFKLIVDDTKQPHRDDVIEEAIHGLAKSEGGLTHNFNVEILKWRKINLDP
ncbi:hypothetical protein N0V84_012739 [Fusarium piperis]|uniref:Uncharacterized protein n=1 Tax=Fusarium piperis TaxID=1435070 RepID=A0A9W8TBG6_9HYPO|nr:hypothetical protein N0V84_012739 [Fusarium piperis]